MDAFRNYDIWLTTSPSDDFEGVWDSYVDKYLTKAHIARYERICVDDEIKQRGDDEHVLKVLAEYGVIPDWDDYTETYGCRSIDPDV